MRGVDVIRSDAHGVWPGRDVVEKLVSVEAARTLLAAIELAIVVAVEIDQQRLTDNRIVQSAERAGDFAEQARGHVEGFDLQRFEREVDRLMIQRLLAEENLEAQLSIVQAYQLKHTVGIGIVGGAGIGDATDGRGYNDLAGVHADPGQCPLAFVLDAVSVGVIEDLPTYDGGAEATGRN